VGNAQLAYVEYTGAVTVSATSEGSPNDVVAAGSLTFDGTTRICIEFYSPRIDVGATAGSFVVVNLWDGDSTDLGRIAVHALASSVSSCLVRRFLTPPNASKNYKIKAWRVNSNGTIQAGAGGAGVSMPGYVRITKA